MTSDITLLPHLEIEFRLGVLNKTFDSNIGLKSFNNIKSLLDNSSCWKATNYESYTDIFYNEVRYNNKTEQSIIKKIIDKSTIKNTPYDIRMSVCQEIPTVCNFTHETLRRNKKRYSYSTEHWSIELTEVFSDSSTSYECELEYINTNYIRTHSLDFLKKVAVKELNNILLSANV
jgi:hypothetical protein